MLSTKKIRSQTKSLNPKMKFRSAYILDKLVFEWYMYQCTIQSSVTPDVVCWWCHHKKTCSPRNTKTTMTAIWAAHTLFPATDIDVRLCSFISTFFTLILPLTGRAYRYFYMWCAVGSNLWAMTFEINLRQWVCFYEYKPPQQISLHTLRPSDVYMRQ